MRKFVLRQSLDKVCIKMSQDKKGYVTCPLVIFYPGNPYRLLIFNSKLEMSLMNYALYIDLAY